MRIKQNNWSRKMKKKLNVIFLILTVVIYFPIYAQKKPLPIITAATNTAAYIIIVKIPDNSEGFYVSRKIAGSKNFVRIINRPVVPVIDPGIIKSILKEDYKWVKKALKANDDFEIIRRLQSDPGTSATLSFASLNVAKAAGRLFVDSNVKEGETYTYKVEFVDYENKTIKDIIRDIKIVNSNPPPPELINSDAGDSHVKISWEYSAYNGAKNDITVGFNIYKSSGNGELRKINKVLILRQEDIKYRTDVDVENNKQYSYIVKAVDIIGRESGSSNKVSVTPVDLTPPKYPQGLETISEEGKVLLTWKMNLELDLSHYDVYKSMKVLGEFKKINLNPIPGDKPFFYDEDVYTGPTYYYKVKAIDKAGNVSEFSNSLSGKPSDSNPPAPPSNLIAVVEGNYVRIKWEAPSDIDLKGYYVYSKRSDLEFLRVNSLPIPSDTLEYYDTGYNEIGLWQGQTYYYAVSAVDNVMNESKMTIVKVLIPDNEPPEKPVSSYAELIGDGIVEITWQPSMSLDVTKYRIYRAENNRQTKIIKETADSIFSVMDSDIKCGNTYGYQVVAVDRAGNESKKTQMVNIIPTDRTIPPNPDNIKIINVVNGVQISWSPVVVDDLLGYNIYKSDLPNGVLEKLNDKPLNNTEYLDTNGKEGIYYTVSSLDTSLHENKAKAKKLRKSKNK
jgi:fibronectin type 3 domain-containing protein